MKMTEERLSEFDEKSTEIIPLCREQIYEY